MIRKRYSSDFREQAVELVSLGKSVSQVAEELGIGTSVLYRWTEAQRQGTAPAQFGGGVQRAVGEVDEAAELRRLRRENAHLRLENDILKKAAVILGTQPQAKPAP
ncbi:MAG: transposase [Prosthecobacter sp.]|nr:transposase [Prosthecobacter sp.]